ncbi:transporter substrate-binding domain-containing protein [Microtetraspora sp. NBRC 16547]|uniref:transporter substrate-binding domain-containing protein n=1 Tax=Microtetraspora sp. NBRC 16547 TaxID=3030993 RepID=UPI0024A5FEA4|nr:transporter substrate-binding domain-containing protein [Microtetraspora sp. NBRC 16547]GLW97961.1 glutamate-binding protein [Microtetraspora sp. NBRC 16547]
MRRVAALLLGLSMVGASLTSCGRGGSLIVGVRVGYPGLVTRLPDEGYTGFDIAVAQYVTRELGYRDGQITYTGDLAEADIVIGTTDARDAAGPYLVTSSDLLVRAGDLTISKPKDLRRRRVCGTVADAAPLVRRFGAAWKAAFLAEGNVPAACAPLLAKGKIDAIVADAPVLVGLDAQYPGRFRLCGDSISTSWYGIHARSGGTREEIDAALRRMFDDGAWNRAVISYLGVLAARYTTPPKLGMT